LWLKKTVVDYGANYVAGSHEIISRRWEAFRDGIEDVRAFYLLQQAVSQAKAANAYEKEIKEAEEILYSAIVRATSVAWDCNDITRFLRNYEMDYKQILQIRKKVAALTMQLSQDSK
jgi:hypothetical protein